MKKIIVFAPHPDDETLGCGGTIMKKIKEGFDVLIVFMCDGRHSHSTYNITSEPTPCELKKTRKNEAIKACNVLGVREENLIFLDFEDTLLRKNMEKAQRNVIEILKKASPVEVYFPHERDPHPDHRATSIIVENSINAIYLKIFKYQYLINSSNIKNKVRNNEKVKVDVSEFLPFKKRAIDKYKSQITLIAFEQKQPILTSSFLDKFRKDVEEFTVKSL